MAMWTKLTLRNKLLVLIMLATLLALVLSSTAFLLYNVYNARERLRDDVSALAETMKANTTNALVFNDRQTAESILSGLSVQPRVVGAWLYDAEGRPFASYSRSATAEPGVQVEGDVFGANSLDLTRTIRFGTDQRPVGSFHLRLDLSEIRRLRAAYLKILLLVLGGVSLVVFALSLVLQRAITKPILDLVAVEERVMKTRDYSIRAPRHSADELGLLIDGFNDMLAQVQARDEELSVQRDRAEQASRSKSAFLANMSHELRTPLTAIIGYSEMLETEAGEMGLVDFLPDLQKIRGAGKHLLGLINSILDLSKVEAGKMQLDLHEFEVAKLVDEVAHTVEALVAKNHSRFEVSVAADVGTAFGDLTKTRQILLNLLSNASKFTDNGVVELQVQRQSRGSGDWLVFRVTDSGIGMTGDQLDRIFEAFSQAEASTARRFGGTGLGLALCKRFAELMGGRILVDSEYGKGSTFTTWIPARVSAEVSGSHRLSERIDTGEFRRPSSRSPELPADARKILVIDDDPAARDLLQTILVKEGFRVFCASDGEEGLRMAKELQPAIITLDVQMPGRDGWTVLGELKATPGLAAIPVIMISVVDSSQKGFALGAAEYLTKPIERTSLVALLSKYRGDEAPVALVVDDDEAVRVMLRRLLEQEGWTVDEAEHGIAALRRVAERQPTLILLDLLMPLMDGFAFLSQLRKNDVYRQIPVVVITAKDLSPEDHERLNGGVASVLEKHGGLSVDELKNEIRSLARLTLRG